MVFDDLLCELFPELETELFILDRWPVEYLQARFHRIKPHPLELIVNLLDGAATPAEAAECPD